MAAPSAYSSDHDILVRLETDFINFRREVNEKLDGIVQDHEKRLRNLEKSKWIGYGVVMTITTLLETFIHGFSVKK